MIALGLSLFLGTSAKAQEFNFITCGSSYASFLHLDLIKQVASIDVYCHAFGCSGTGKILSNKQNLFCDTFLLEMDMGLSSVQHMMITVAPDGTGEIY